MIMAPEDFVARMRAHRFNWMPRPYDWIWTTHDGRTQGFSLNLCREGAPGMANLLWLAMELDKPPIVYDARAKPLYTFLAVQGADFKLNGLPLFDQAGSLTLPQFRTQCDGKYELEGPMLAPNLVPVLRDLIDRRIAHAA